MGTNAVSMEGQDATCRGPRAVPDVRLHATAQPPWPGFRHLLPMAQAERALEESRHKSNLTRSELQCSIAQRPTGVDRNPGHTSLYTALFTKDRDRGRAGPRNRQRDLLGPKAVGALWGLQLWEGGGETPPEAACSYF